MATHITQVQRPSCKSWRNFIIFLVNINGIENKLEELKLLIHNTHADIITIKEAKAKTPKLHKFATVRTSILQTFIISPRDSTSTHYKTADTDIQHCIQHVTNIPHSVLTSDVNAHSTLCHSYTDGHTGQLIAYVISKSDPITLNTTTLTRESNTTLQQTCSPDISTVCNTLYIYIFICTYFLHSSTQKMQLYTNKIYKNIIILLKYMNKINSVMSEN